MSITLISIILILFKGGSIRTLFIYASKYDMVWDYFRLSTPSHIIINGVLWVSLILLIRRSETRFKNYLLYVIIVFINPLNFNFMTQFLAGNVVHRVMDVLFNPVMILIMFSVLYEKLYVVLKVVIIGLICYVSFNYQTNPYHFVFVRDENSSYLDRINQNELEVMNVLNTKITLEKIENPKVISQIIHLKAFVKGIELPLSYRTYRKLDIYDVVDAPNELWNIFVNRDLGTTQIFKQTPDTNNTCQYLVEEEPDFVLVDKDQFYFDGENYVPIYFRVRGCGTNIYENDDYILYQFYW